MAIKQRDREFRLPKITYVDYKTIEMDRVLISLFPRLRFGPVGSRRPPRRRELELSTFLDEFKKHDAKIVQIARKIMNSPKYMAEFERSGLIRREWFPDSSDSEIGLAQKLVIDIQNRISKPDIWFQGILESQDSEDVLRKWLETDLMDMVNRGKPNQAIASPRPLHGNTYKFRNAKHSRDYNASDQVFWMLYYARRGRGQNARNGLRDFFFKGVDLVTDEYNPQVTVDVETQALLHLDQQVTRADRPDDKKAQELEKYPPLCLGQADLLADDVLRLLTYQDYMPRSVLVEYLKSLFAFHLALFHLRLLKLLPALVGRKGADPICSSANCPMNPTSFDTPHGSCPYRVGILVDMGEPNNIQMTELARRSADIHYRRIPPYIQAHLVAKKLDEMAEYLRKLNRLPLPAAGYFSIGEILQLLQSKFGNERENYFQYRLTSIIEDTTGDDKESPPEIRRITDLGLNSFETYIEILVTMRGQFYRQYITESLDAFLLKNSDSGMLRQFRAKNSPRFFSIGSRLLELLVQLAVLQPVSAMGSTFETRDIRIDDLITFFRERYGLYIDRLPLEDGFNSPSILDQQALRRNVEAFKNRLREIGFFQDLSDAYLTQTVTSRYKINHSK